MEDRQVTTTLLQCQACGGALTGGDNDRVFYCRPCRRAFEPWKGKLQAVDLAGVRELDALSGGAPHLPIWMFDVQARPEAASELQKRKGAVFFGQGKVFVPAFRMLTNVYGDPGVTMTRGFYLERHKGNRALIEVVRPCAVIPGPATIGSGLASKFVESTLLAVIDPVVDVTGLKLEIAIKSAALLSAWFREKNGRAGIMGLSDEYPVSAFGGLLGEKENPGIGGGEPVPGA
jgi:hypothetical protein